MVDRIILQYDLLFNIAEGNIVGIVAGVVIGTLVVLLILILACVQRRRLQCNCKKNNDKNNGSFLAQAQTSIINNQQFRYRTELLYMFWKIEQQDFVRGVIDTTRNIAQHIVPNICPMYNCMTVCPFLEVAGVMKKIPF